MKVCVTGASGFIGQHVCRALMEAGHEVMAMDVYKPPLGSWLVADIQGSLSPLPGLDAVVHLAAIAAPMECDKDPARAFSVNVNGTLQVLKMALESGAKKVIFSSTAHVYGVGPKYLPTDEMHPLSLGNTYTTTKILGEQLCQLFWANHGLSYTTLRLFNAYGPGQRAGYFVPDQLAKVKQGVIPLMAGATTKDFVHVEDVARAFVLAIETPFIGVVNIGSGKETMLAEVVAFITAATKTRFDPGDMFTGATRMQADISRAKRILGWEPRVDIWEGLRATIGTAEKVAV